MIAFARTVATNQCSHLSEVKIIPATDAHRDGIWQIFQEVVAAGDTYVFDPKTTRDQALSYWLSPQAHTFVAVDGNQVCGTYIIKENQPGLGSHVANASYMVASSARGRGIGSLLCVHSLDQARQLGFTAMQFNIVVSTNESAIALWKKHGFRIVGTLPKVFRHARLGEVDAFVMHRFL
jgi:L-amino acid N-acyltransferase YncA